MREGRRLKLFNTPLFVLLFFFAIPLFAQVRRGRPGARSQAGGPAPRRGGARRRRPGPTGHRHHSRQRTAHPPIAFIRSRTTRPEATPVIIGSLLRCNLEARPRLTGGTTPVFRGASPYLSTAGTFGRLLPPHPSLFPWPERCSERIGSPSPWPSPPRRGNSLRPRWDESLNAEIIRSAREVLPFPGAADEVSAKDQNSLGWGEGERLLRLNRSWARPAFCSQNFLGSQAPLWLFPSHEPGSRGRESAHSEPQNSQRRLTSATTVQGFKARTIRSGGSLLGIAAVAGQGGTA